jgi:hypothetical protein
MLVAASSVWPLYIIVVGFGHDWVPEEGGVGAGGGRGNQTTTNNQQQTCIHFGLAYYDSVPVDKPHLS